MSFAGFASPRSTMTSCCATTIPAHAAAVWVTPACPSSGIVLRYLPQRRPLNCTPLVTVGSFAGCVGLPRPGRPVLGDVTIAPSRVALLPLLASSFAQDEERLLCCRIRIRQRLFR